MHHPSYVQLALLTLEMLGKYQSTYTVSQDTLHDYTTLTCNSYKYFINLGMTSVSVSDSNFIPFSSYTHIIYHISTQGPTQPQVNATTSLTY